MNRDVVIVGAGSLELASVPMTHKQLVRRVGDWLKNAKRYTVVMTELATQNDETPDVIGWHGRAASTLIECKVSRDDFNRDKGKRFRKLEELGMGDLRYYAAPAGILKGNDIPPGWGWLEVHGRSVREMITPLVKGSNKAAEVKMLMSAIRRLEISTAVFVRSENLSSI